MKADMWPTIAADDDVDALHRDAAARRGIALDDEQAALAGGPADWRHCPSPAPARHHVLGDADAGVAVDDDFACLFMPAQ
jgi:hypothetical protein